MYVKKHGKITNREYIDLNNVSRITATIDLSELVEKKILKQQGEGKENLIMFFYEAKMKQKKQKLGESFGNVWGLR